MNFKPANPRSALHSAIAVTDGLRIYDISNPATPVDVGHVNDIGDYGYAADVAVARNLVYLACDENGLRIYSWDKTTARKPRHGLERNQNSSQIKEP